MHRGMSPVKPWSSMVVGSVVKYLYYINTFLIGIRILSDEVESNLHQNQEKKTEKEKEKNIIKRGVFLKLHNNLLNMKPL